MLSRGVNYWISWADLTFMLFIASLAAVTVSEEHRIKAQQQLIAARGELEVLRRHSNPCADAGPFLSEFSTCVAKATGRKQLQRSGCFVTVGEDVIQFANGKAVPLDATSADAVAGCLYDSALSFSKNDAGSFDTITIHVDGHTDCVGTSRDNEKLGAERALSVYSRLLGRAESDAAWPSPEAKRAFLSRIAVRSFGDTRPVDGSRCTQARLGERPTRDRFGAARDGADQEAFVISTVLMIFVALLLAITFGFARRSYRQQLRLERDNDAMQRELARNREAVQSILRELENS